MEQERIRHRDAVDAGGYAVIYHCMTRDPLITDGAFRTYLLLLYYAQQSDSCYPGQEALARDRGVNSRTIRRHLEELESRNLLTIERRGDKQTNVYWLESIHKAYADRQDKNVRSLPATPTDRTKMSDRDRTSESGPVRTKTSSNNNVGVSANADISKSSPNVERFRRGSRYKNGSLVHDTSDETFTKVEGDDIPGHIREIIELTGDEKSLRRYRQLYDLCWQHRKTAAWGEARRSLMKRLASKSEEPLTNPGAYFCRVLVFQLEERGVVVPSGTKAEREEVRGLIGASLGLGDSE